jgi:hypothetical protein
VFSWQQFVTLCQNERADRFGPVRGEAKRSCVRGEESSGWFTRTAEDFSSRAQNIQATAIGIAKGEAWNKRKKEGKYSEVV